MAAVPLEAWYYDIPVCTRLWTSAALVTAVACQCQLISPFQLFFSVTAVFSKRQYWRLITAFLYFGPLSLDFMFHIFFMARYSRMLEDTHFRGKTADYAWLILYCCSCLLFFSAVFVQMPFLGSPLAFSLVYIWSRRNPNVRLSFLGLFVFNAPYLPWVLLGFSLLLNGNMPKDDMLGIVVGHFYFFMMDIYPTVRGGARPLDPPEFWRRLFEPRTEAANPVQLQPQQQQFVQ
ncbi:Derlin-2 [Dactylella cylindrospora]|nr:Derlin-2 [Dactylella cylindrospora]